jgi:hypothetical protein
MAACKQDHGNGIFATFYARYTSSDHQRHLIIIRPQSSYQQDWLAI